MFWPLQYPLATWWIVFDSPPAPGDVLFLFAPCISSPHSPLNPKVHRGDTNKRLVTYKGNWCNSVLVFTGCDLIVNVSWHTMRMWEKTTTGPPTDWNKRLFIHLWHFLVDVDEKEDEQRKAVWLFSSFNPGGLTWRALVWTHITALCFTMKHLLKCLEQICDKWHDILHSVLLYVLTRHFPCEKLAFLTFSTPQSLYSSKPTAQQYSCVQCLLSNHFPVVTQHCIFILRCCLRTIRWSGSGD